MYNLDIRIPGNMEAVVIQIRRMIVILATVTVALTGLWQVGRLWDAGVAAASPLLTPTLEASPSPTPTGTPVFSATLSIVPDRTSLRVGETLTLVADIDVSEGCQYPILELSLYQATDEPPIFAHIDPPADLLTAPITLPSAWTFRATHPGTATFDARSYGERYCNDFWNWHYLSGQSEPIRVDPAAAWLPLVSR